MPILIAAIVVILLVMWGSKLYSARAQTQHHEKELLRLCMGDQEMAIRLTMFELKRNPALSHAEAVRSAVQSYKRDT